MPKKPTPKSDKPRQKRGRPPRKKPEPRPVIPYGDPFKSITLLEQGGQPWAIARYPMKARFVDGEITYVYELLIFQTLDREEPNDNFVMPRATFREIMQKYGLRCRYRTKTSGEIYEKDDKLREVGRRYRREVEAMQSQLRAIRDQQYDLTEDAASEKDETLKLAIRALRDEKRNEAAALDKKIKAFKDAFCKREKIIQFQLY